MANFVDVVYMVKLAVKCHFLSYHALSLCKLERKYDVTQAYSSASERFFIKKHNKKLLSGLQPSSLALATSGVHLSR